MNIWLVRHGKTVDDANGVIQLDDAKLSKDHLHLLDQTHKTIDGINFDSIYCSPQVRATETAKYLLPSKEYKKLDLLREYKRPEILDGKEREFAISFWEDKYVKEKYDPDWSIDNSESINDILNRVDSFIEILSNTDDKNIIVIGHGVFFRHLIGRIVMQNDYSTTVFFKFLLKTKLNNGGIAKLNFDKSQKTGQLIEIINTN